METPHDRGLTPPEPVDAPEAPADSPWVMTAEALRATSIELGEDNPCLSAMAPMLLIDALADILDKNDAALMLPLSRADFAHAVPLAVQAWYLPCNIDVVDLDGSVIDCDRLEEWENGTLQARWAEDAADDALLGDL